MSKEHPATDSAINWQERAEVVECLAKRICRDLRHALDDVPADCPHKAYMVERYLGFKQDLGDTADYVHALHYEIRRLTVSLKTASAPSEKGKSGFEDVVAWVERNPHPIDPDSRVQVYKGDWTIIVSSMRSAIAPKSATDPRDAARYRWLREKAWGNGGDGLNWFHVEYCFTEKQTRADLDAYIDRYMTKEPV